MRNFTMLGTIILLLVNLFVAGCNYVVELDDFAGYKDWQVVDYAIGSTNPALGEAHMNTNDNFSRRTYMSPDAQKIGEGFIPGTIFVKETFTWEDGEKVFAEMGGILVMVKRDGPFNPNGGGWEWIIPSPDLSEIVDRGGEEIMGGACNSCHNLAKTQTGGADSVFPHPTEYAAVNADFEDFSEWTMIGETSESHPVLGSAHKGDNPDAVRRVYKKQIMANPDTEDQGYPIGTVILKEVEEDSEITEITAMVKRGGAFNADNSNWEWFMLDPSTRTIMDQGADLMGNMCNSCHQSAKNPDFGKDYVFKYPGDPFNK